MLIKLEHGFRSRLMMTLLRMALLFIQYGIGREWIHHQRMASRDAFFGGLNNLPFA